MRMYPKNIDKIFDLLTMKWQPTLGLVFSIKSITALKYTHNYQNHIYKFSHEVYGTVTYHKDCYEHFYDFLLYILKICDFNGYTEAMGSSMTKYLFQEKEGGLVREGQIFRTGICMERSGWSDRGAIGGRRGKLVLEIRYVTEYRGFYGEGTGGQEGGGMNDPFRFVQYT